MIGQTISHYKILEKLGEGGMGVVYKAHDTKLDRPVALKILSSEHGSEDNRAQLLREARATAAIHHPNICSIIDVLEFDGQEFLVMEFIEGQSLRTLLGAGPLDISMSINIALQIAEGLHAAHKKRIIHRDIKPENILITRDNVAKIADFGLARGIEQQVTSDSNTIAGTVAYMSPEQLQGLPIDCTTDIWSLGVILYEMVTGQRPFVGVYTEALMYEITNGKQRPVSILRKDVPGSLEIVIDRCLEKIPAIRFSDAKMLIDELQLVERATNNPRGNEVKSIAVLPFADISPGKDNQYFSEGLTEEIISNLSKLRTVRVFPRTSVMQYDRAEKTAKQIAADLGVQYILEGSVRKHGHDLRITTQLIDAANETYQWSEKYRGTMEDIFDIQETVAGKIAKALKVRLTPGEKKNLKQRPTGNTEAYQLYLKGRYFWNRRNKEGLRTAIKYFEAAIEKDSRYALAWAGISDSYNLIGEYEGVSRKDTYLKAKEAVHRALELDAQLAEARTSLACLIMLYEWDWTNAEKEFKLAIYLQPNYATAHHWFSEWLLYMGRMEDALREIARAAELDPLSPAILKDWGVVHYYSRQYDAAIEFATKALELDPAFSAAHRVRSLAYQGKGMFSEAAQENRRWVELSGNRMDGQLAEAQLHAVSGNTHEALRIIAGLPKENLKSGNTFRGMALVFAALEDKDHAFEWLEKGYAIRSETLTSLKVDPKLDKLRTDPRFNVLLKKIGLEK